MLRFVVHQQHGVLGHAIFWVAFGFFDVHAIGPQDEAPHLFGLGVDVHRKIGGLTATHCAFYGAHTQLKLRDRQGQGTGAAHLSFDCIGPGVVGFGDGLDPLSNLFNLGARVVSAESAVQDGLEVKLAHVHRLGERG